MCVCVCVCTVQMSAALYSTMVNRNCAFTYLYTCFMLFLFVISSVGCNLDYLLLLHDHGTLDIRLFI